MKVKIYNACSSGCNEFYMDMSDTELETIIKFAELNNKCTGGYVNFPEIAILKEEKIEKINRAVYGKAYTAENL